MKQQNGNGKSLAIQRPWAVKYCNGHRCWERDAGAPHGWVPLERQHGVHGHPTVARQQRFEHGRGA